MPAAGAPPAWGPPAWGHRRASSPAGYPEGEPLERAGPGGQCRDQPVTFRLSEQLLVPAVCQSASLEIGIISVLLPEFLSLIGE